MTSTSFICRTLWRLYWYFDVFFIQYYNLRSNKRTLFHTSVISSLNSSCSLCNNLQWIIKSFDFYEVNKDSKSFYKIQKLWHAKKYWVCGGGAYSFSWPLQLQAQVRMLNWNSTTSNVHILRGISTFFLICSSMTGFYNSKD